MVGDIQHIVVIQSLSVNEVSSGKNLYDDIIARGIALRKNGMTHEYFDVRDKHQLIEILKYVNAQAPYRPSGVLIHLEMHGSKDLDGLVLANKQLISWNELVELFRDINVNTKNHLYITMATCYGRYLYEGVDPEKKSPYSGYISASKEVMVAEVVDDFGQLFESLLINGNLVKSYLELAETSNFYYKDSKTTFEENILNVKYKFDNDHQFRQQFIDDVQAEGAFNNIKLTDEEIEEIRRQAFNDIVRRQKTAFEFPADE